MPDGQEFTNVRPIGAPTGEFTNVRPIGAPAQPIAAPQQNLTLGNLWDAVGGRLSQLGKDVWQWGREKTQLTPEQSEALDPRQAGTWWDVSKAPAQAAGLGKHLLTGAMNVAQMPVDIYHAMTAPPSESELTEDWASRTIGRLVAHPMDRAVEQASRYWSAGHPYEAARQAVGAVPGVGPWLESKTEIAYPTPEARAAGARPDPFGAAVELGTEAALMKKAADVPKDVIQNFSMVRHIVKDRAVAMQKGATALTTSAKQPLAHLDANIRANVGKVYGNVTSLDSMDMAMKGQQVGMVNTLDAVKEFESRLSKEDLVNFPDAATKQIAERMAAGRATLQETLNEVTNMGEKLSRLRRAGNDRAAYAVQGLRDGLKEAALNRIRELDPRLVDGFKKTSEDFATYSKMRHGYVEKVGDTFKSGGGVLDDFINEQDHTKAVSVLEKSKGAFNEVGKFARLYNVDTGALDAALRDAPTLRIAMDQNRNAFFGVMRGIRKHPIGVTAAYMGTPLPWIGRVIVAARISGLLDDLDAAKLIREWTQRAGPGGTRIYPEGHGPQPLPPTPTPTMGTVPPGGMAGYQPGKGAAAAQMIEEPPKTTPEQVAQSRTSEIERLKGVLASEKATPEEKTIAESQIKTHEELRAEPKLSETLYPSAEMEQAELARRLSRAKKARGRR